MPEVVERLARGARVAVVRLRSLGDCVLSTPALRLLKAHRPDLRVAVVVESAWRAVYEGNPDVDEILEPGVGALWRFGPDLVVNLHGGARSARLVAASRARWRAGFGHYRNAWLYNVRIPRAQEILGEERVVHTAEHAASAMFYLGVPVTGIPRARLFVTGNVGRPRPYAVIHPKASAAEKTWAAERFAECARWMERELGLEAVVIGAAGDDLSAFEGFTRVQGAPLEEVKGLLAGAEIFLGNDSGPAHMSAALAVPVVVLFGPSDPAIWGPWRVESETRRRERGLRELPVEEVTEALAKLRVRTAAQAGRPTA
jgi:ADP-heptose:LPS heptosyltransferase